jgi:hypothetical protein
VPIKGIDLRQTIVEFAAKHGARRKLARRRGRQDRIYDATFADGGLIR